MADSRRLLAALAVVLLVPLARLLGRDAKADRAKAEAEQVAHELDAMLIKRSVTRGSIIGPAESPISVKRIPSTWPVLYQPSRSVPPA